MLAEILAHSWWMTLLRGALWLLFGILVFVQPGITLVALTMLFGAFVLLDGAVNIASAIRGRKERDNWWVLFLLGLVGTGVGVLALSQPALTGLVLLFYIATWAIASGLLEIVAAIRLRKEIQGEFWLVLAGLVSVAFGVALLARPEAGIRAMLWLLGAFAIASGLILVVLSFAARGFVPR
jgi:uncharacterized membrane protein HdeD (DUF308 family)